MATPLHIDFVSDVACPWCVIGLRGLLKALDAVGDGVDAQIQFHPFELNPQMPPEGENTAEHIAKKYGSTREQSEAARQVLKQRGAELGFTFNYGPESRIWNTFDAHRLLHWAGLEGRQLELKQALFASTFTEQRPSNDTDALVDAARQAGLDAGRAREVLNSGAYAEAVRAEEQLWVGRGVRAVPTIVFNQRWLVQGGQPAEAFERAIRAIVAGTA